MQESISGYCRLAVEFNIEECDSIVSHFMQCCKKGKGRTGRSCQMLRFSRLAHSIHGTTLFKYSSKLG